MGDTWLMTVNSKEKASMNLHTRTFFFIFWELSGPSLQLRFDWSVHLSHPLPHCSIDCASRYTVVECIWFECPDEGGLGGKDGERTSLTKLLLFVCLKVSFQRSSRAFPNIGGTEHQGHVLVGFPVFDPGSVIVQMGLCEF